MVEKEVSLIKTKQEFVKILDTLQLSQRQEAIFIMRYGKVMMYEDIAIELELSRKTVSKEMKTIRNKLACIDFNSI